MTLCDMCGKKDASVIALVEGTELSVCTDCSKFGKIKKKISHIIEQSKIKDIIKNEKEPKEEFIETIVRNYGKLVKGAREKLNLNQEDFGKKINEKVSVIHNIESEHHEPNIELAKKLEKFLKIKLIQEEKIEKISLGKKDSNPVTIGDLIKIK